MADDFSINISDFIGIYRAIADKVNINGGNTLEGEEISLFNDVKKTINSSKSIFTFENKTYNESGQECSKNDYLDISLKNKSVPANFYEYSASIKKNELALQKADEYAKAMEKIRQQHEKVVTRIANSWADTHKITDRTEFREFVSRLYDVAKKLNITVTNDGTTKETFKPSSKYPTIEDQIVDEICGIFAQESSFSPKAVSGRYFGIFQFSQVALNSLRRFKYIPSPNLAPIEGNKIENFTKLTRLQQLDYMVAYTDNCKKNASFIDGKPIAPKNMYAMWHYPDQAFKKSNCDKKEGKILKRMNERDSSSPIKE